MPKQIPNPNHDALALENSLNHVIGDEVIKRMKSNSGDKSLTMAQLNKTWRLLSGQLEPFTLRSEVIEGAVGSVEQPGGAIDKVDVGYHTFLRLWEVFSNVIANHNHSDGDNPNSSFNKVLHSPEASWSFGMLFILPAMIGFWIRLRKLQSVRERNSIPYQQQQLREIFSQQKIDANEIEKEVSEAAILAGYQDLLDRGKVARAKKIKTQKESAAEKAIEPGQFVKTVNEVKTHPIMEWVNFGWTYLANTALLFWPAWMTSVLFVGFVASYTFPVLLPVVLACFTVSALIMGGLWYVRRRRQQKAKADIYIDAENKNPQEFIQSETEENKQELAEVNRMRKELKFRLHMKKGQALFNKIFNVITPDKSIDEANKKNTYHVAATKGEGLIVLLKDPNVISVADKENPEAINEKEIEKILESDIGKYLLGSRAARNGRIAVSMVLTLSGQYTLSAFVLWLLGSALLVCAPAAAVFGVISSLVLGSIFPGISTAFNFLVGSIYSIGAFAGIHADQTNFEKNVYLKLSEKYQSTVSESELNGKTKKEVFEHYDNLVKERKNNIRGLLEKKQNALRLKREELTPEEQYILNYDLQATDVFNDRYSRTQQKSPSLKTKANKVLRRLYTVANAGQTWIFVARSLFLAGGALAGICLLCGPGAMVAFIAIALTMAVIGIVLKMTQVYMNRRVAERKFFLETFDARISGLKKEAKRLGHIETFLEKRSSIRPEDGEENNPDAEKGIELQPITEKLKQVGEGLFNKIKKGGGGSQEITKSEAHTKQTSLVPHDTIKNSIHFTQFKPIVDMKKEEAAFDKRINASAC